MRVFSIILATVIFTIAAFGSFAMGSMDSSENHICPLGPMSSVDCPQTVGSLELASHHMAGLQQLTQASETIKILLALVVLAAVQLFVLFNTVLSTLLMALSQKLRAVENLVVQSRRKFVRWFIIKHKKDPHAHLSRCMNDAALVLR